VIAFTAYISLKNQEPSVRKVKIQRCYSLAEQEDTLFVPTSVLLVDCVR